MSVVVPSNKLYHPVDLAVDYIGRLLFWTCSSQDAINVTRLDNGSTVGIVVNNKGEKPRLIAIHPTKRFENCLSFYKRNYLSGFILCVDYYSIPKLVRRFN